MECKLDKCNTHAMANLAASRWYEGNNRLGNILVRKRVN